MIFVVEPVKIPGVPAALTILNESKAADVLIFIVGWPPPRQNGKIGLFAVAGIVHVNDVDRTMFGAHEVQLLAR